MRRCLLFFVFCLSTILNAQIPREGTLAYKELPQWAKEMYKDNPNIFLVDSLYKDFYKKKTFKKNKHTRYYKKWRRVINPFIKSDGYYDFTKKTKFVEKLNQNSFSSETKSNAVWSSIGPIENFRPGGTIQSGRLANVYVLNACATNPNIMYCGTECGEIFRSTDGGENWSSASKSLVTDQVNYVTFNFGISSLAVHPTNPDIVYAGSSGNLYKTTDAGLNWAQLNVAQNMSSPLWEVVELLVHETQPNIVFFASSDGLFRSTDNGNSWSSIIQNRCFDIKQKPNSPNVLYTITENQSTGLHEFLVSTDFGVSWTIQTQGWYYSADPNKQVTAGKIGVTPANPNVVYAYLTGKSKADDNGFIGVYRSSDSGLSWTNTRGYDGAPYSSAQPNVSSSNGNDGFDGGQYNNAFLVSETNENEILAGGIGMYYSSDGGNTFSCVYNYSCTNTTPMHVDMQDFRVIGGQYWASTDGGVFKSNDMFLTTSEFKSKGIRASDFWGFGMGWNYDVMVGGLYHNGVTAYYENYPSGYFMSLGGGEPASGYVNPGDSLKVYSRNVNTVVLPDTYQGTPTFLPLGELPNEDSWIGESSEIVFHPDTYNTLYLGKENKLFKSTNGGTTFTSIFELNNLDSEVLGIRISRQNPGQIYLIERPSNNGSARLIKTTDEFQTHQIINLPDASQNLALVELSLEDDNVVWIAYPRGSNSNNIFKSINGGNTWTNESDALLDFQTINSLLSVAGTNDGIYVGTNMGVYYKNNSINWTSFNNNLPQSISTQRLRPFYRDGKIRMASYGKGVWESSFYEAPQYPTAKIMVDKTETSRCNDIFYFEDYSTLNHANASWAWTFENANISSSNLRNPQVLFNSIGSHNVTLTVTDSLGNSDTDSIVIFINQTQGYIDQNFEIEFLPSDWYLENSSNFSWEYNTSVGGFGNSSSCMSVNNYYTDQSGETCDYIAIVNLQNTSPADAVLNFDVAYTYFDSNNQDNLEVLISTDCGMTYTSEYFKDGPTLATAPPTASLFIPDSSQWRTDTIDLAAYAGQEHVYIKFRNINDYGQMLYIDNINIDNTSLSILEIDNYDLFVYPNPASSQGELTVKFNNDESIEIVFYDQMGRTIKKINTLTNKAIPLQNMNLSEGVYIYSISSNNRIKNGKLVIKDYSR